MSKVNSQAKNAAHPPLNTSEMMRFLEPGYYVNPVAANATPICTLVLLLGMRERACFMMNAISSMKIYH